MTTKPPFQLFQDNHIQVSRKITFPFRFHSCTEFVKVFVHVVKKGHSTIAVEQPHVSDPDLAIK